MGDAGHQRFGFAGEGVAAPASVAVAAIAAVPANADALANGPSVDAPAGGIDEANDLVARHARIMDVREQAFLRYAVAVADAAGLYLDPHLVGRGFRNVAFD
jgi:hypothetical protein